MVQSGVILSRKIIIYPDRGNWDNQGKRRPTTIVCNSLIRAKTTVTTQGKVEIVIRKILFFFCI